MHAKTRIAVDFVLRAAIVILTALPAVASIAADKPNIIVMLADDMGYGDLGCFGHPTIRTPELDRMARQGMKMTQFYVGASVCTPSRAALLTGRYPIRSGLTHVLIPSSPGGLPDEEITLAEVLKQAGYATACIGKWHLGSRPEQLPNHHGFDYFFGIPYSNDMSPETQPDNPLFKDSPPTPLIRNLEVTNKEREPDQSQLTKKYTEEAIQFMRQHSGKGPFFIYLAHTMPHVPLYASEKFHGRSPRGLYGDTVEELDWSAGEILRTLAELRIEKNTLTVFLSDNGPWLGKKRDGGSSGPFFEGKVSTWEGGFRVPAILHWPGRIPAGVTSTAFATAMDLYSTAAKLGGEVEADIQIPREHVFDGQDLSPVLFDGAPGRAAEMFYYFGDELWAVRKGPWKMHVKTTKPASVEKWGNWPIENHDPPLLFHIDSDPQERFNLAAENPTVVATLRNLFQRHKNSIKPGKPQR
jgi:arylsulfatase A